jgi:hypothetical protein
LQARLVVDDRQRIERDIHDGVQPRLTALRIRLSLAAERFDARGDPEVSATFLDLGDQVDEAIDELREVAHAAYPPLLASGGLGAALRAAASRAAHPVTVNAVGIGRYPREVESAIYFAVLAALDNAARYAGVAPVAVTVWEDGRLHFVVADGGQGFTVNGSPAGGGLANMRDRIAAVKGTFKVESSPSDGTRITGAVSGCRDVAATGTSPKGLVLTPPQSSPATLPADPTLSILPPDRAEPLAFRVPLPLTFALRCADAHPVNCDEEWQSSSPGELVASARAHGARAHGFTPVWYSPQRIAAMTAAVAES